MPSRTDRTTGEIDWPEWAERTPAAQRKRTSKFSVTQHQATKRLEAELLDRVDADDWRLSTAAAHRKNDGMPYADANPDDPGVVVRWTKEGEQDKRTNWYSVTERGERELEARREWEETTADGVTA